MQYRYYSENNLHCSSCGQNWTLPGGIDLQLCVAEQVVSVKSSLTPDGFLEDTGDEAVAKGFHSATCCGGCGELLINMDNVEEWLYCRHRKRQATLG